VNDIRRMAAARPSIMVMAEKAVQDTPRM